MSSAGASLDTAKSAPTPNRSIGALAAVTIYSIFVQAAAGDDLDIGQTRVIEHSAGQASQLIEVARIETNGANLELGPSDLDSAITFATPARVS